MLDLWELSLLDVIQAHCRSAWGDLVMPAISSLGNNGLIWLGLTVVLGVALGALGARLEQTLWPALGERLHRQPREI